METKLQRGYGARGLVASSLCALLLGGCVSWPLNEEADDQKSQPEPEVVEQSAVSPGYNRNDQSPGFFRMRMGSYTVTALYDGSFELNSSLMKGRPQANIVRLLRTTKQPKSVRTSVNAFLLDDGQRVILIDTGASPSLNASMGKLASSLQMSGYSPENVQYVLLTHLHPDHDGGLTVDGKMAFPNAQVYLPQAEATYWLANDHTKSESSDKKDGELSSVAPYQAAGQYHTFEVGSDPIPGVKSVAIPGHTPGHSGYRIRSGTESMLIWGDVIHNVGTQFIDPNITVEFDQEQAKARVTRTKILREAASSAEWIAGSHLPFPGIGRVQAVTKTSYRWLPIDYAQAMMDADKRQPVGAK